MISVVIGVLEDGRVCIFDDIAHATREWSRFPRDVESGVIVFYDSDGTWLEPRLERSAPRLCVLLRRAEPDGSVDPIGLALAEASTLEPNRHAGSLSELRLPFS